MTTSDWLMILAVLLSPLLALQVQKWIEAANEMKHRKRTIFKTLMTTRATRLSANHVEALNMIDIEFSEKDRKEKGVRDAWNSYRDHLNQEFDDASFQVWVAENDRLFTTLLFELSQYLGYNYDRVMLMRGFYRPKAHGEVELAQLAIRRSLVDILSGERPLPMSLIVPPEDHERHREVQRALLEVLNGGRAVRVDSTSATED